MKRLILLGPAEDAGLPFDLVDITVRGFIGGGQPYGEGLCINAGRTSTFHLTGIHTLGTNVVIGPGVSEIVLDGGGQEKNWTISIDPASRSGISFPLLSQPFAQ
jgi:hypothetical protein